MHTYPEQEQEWLGALKNGSEEAFTAIYNHYFESLYLYAFKVLKDGFLAEDVVQELFLSIWKQRHTLRVATSLKAYLYAANRYLIIKAVRKQENTASLFDRLEERVWGPPEQENILYLKELQARVHGIVNDLPEKCREIYLLSREAKHSHKEIAAMLGIAEKTVENQLTIALKKIRTSMGALIPLLSILLK
jgi:RNA polymerase sigma-70 factor (ECF subfamily)